MKGKQFRVMPTVEELVADLAADGITIDLATAKAMWDRATVAMLADKGIEERSQRLFKKIDPDMVNHALGEGMSLSAYLEGQDPTDNPRDQALGVDAFSRAVAQLDADNGAQIRILGNAGGAAHSVKDFWEAGEKLAGGTTTGRCLYPDLMMRAMKEGEVFSTQKFAGQSLFYSSSSPLWPGLNPQWLAQPITGQPRLRASLLGQLVGFRTTVKSAEFKWPKIVDQPTKTRMRRVAEGAEFPVTRLVISSDGSAVYKYGVAIEVTDEVASRTPIDFMRYTLARIGAQNALDKEYVIVVEVIVGGGITETDITTIGGVTGEITGVPLDNFLGLMEEDGFPPTITIGQRATTTLLKNATTGDGNTPLFRGQNAVRTGANTPEELEQPPIYSRSYAPTGKLVYIDGTSAVGEFTEAGSAKTETDRFITRQTNVLVTSERVGYHLMETAAARILDTAN